LSTITIQIGAKVNLKSDAFGNGFGSYYNKNKKKAGVYTYSNEKWNYTEQ
jgi:hypothetical protein